MHFATVSPPVCDYRFCVTSRPKTPPRQRSDGARRRDEILDAALRCFSRRGLLSVGIEEIRREAQASPSSMYHLFGDLDAIRLGLLLRVFDALFAHIAARIQKTRNAKRAVYVLVDSHIEWIAKHPAEGRFMYGAMLMEGRGLSVSAHKQLVAGKAAGFAPIAAHLQRFVADGQIPAWPPSLLDVVLLGVAHEALRRFLAGAPEFDPVLLRKRLPALAWNSVSAAALPRRARRNTTPRA